MMSLDPRRDSIALAWMVVALALGACSSDDASSSSTASGTEATGPTNGAGPDSVGAGASGAGASGAGASSAAEGPASTAATSAASSGAGAGPIAGFPPPGFLGSCDPPPGGPLPSLALTTVAQGFVDALQAKWAPGDPSALYVVEQSGYVRRVAGGSTQTFLDVTQKTMFGYERGLLAIAFHPAYEQNGRFFIHYNAPAGDTVIEERRRSLSNPLLADSSFAVTVLTHPHPAENHNGGSIEFGADGYLYIALGDGAFAPESAQNLGSRFGKILRIDVDNPSGGNAYGIPPGNMSGGLPEIWDRGLRNPWRATFDLCTGDLFIADNGNDDWEEINVEPAGKGHNNYGWPILEGTHCFPPYTSCTPPAGAVPPVYEYGHFGSGASVIGGYVYRGLAAPALRGTYFFADIVWGRTWAMRPQGTQWMANEITSDLGTAGDFITSFGQDAQGEVYVVTYYDVRRVVLE
jgi:glucose/arabinose dehydrogenase